MRTDLSRPRRLLTLFGVFGLCLGTGALVLPAPLASVPTASAAPLLDPNDPANTTKYPHYFGPYPNWANSPQVLADAIVEITPQPGDTGTGATATATVVPKTGGIGAITVTSPGSGYAVAPNVVISSPGITPTSLATATAAISLGSVSSIAVDQAGFGFTNPQIAITGGGSPSVPASAVVSGGVDNVTVIDGGVYEVEPVVVFSQPNLPALQGGVQATGTATMVSLDPNAVPPTFVVTDVAVVDPGAGYTSAPTVTIFDGSLTKAAPTPANVAATIGISKVDVTAGGEGYDSTPSVTILDNGTADLGASATATLAAKGAVTGITVTKAGAGYLTPGIKKFVDTLAGLGPTAANNLGNYIPVAVPDTTTYPGSDYYEIALVQYRQRFSSSLPATGTLLRGYVQLSTSVTKTMTDPATGQLVDQQVPLTNANLDPNVAPAPAMLPGNLGQAIGVDSPRYLGPTIVAQKDRPVRITFRNLLPNGVEGNLFLPVDTSLMGSGMGPDAVTLNALGIPNDTVADLGTVTDGVRNPECGKPTKMVDGSGQTICYTENRATLHLHGGVTPWISDGTPHQWITPAGENTAYPKGVSVSNVPDMPDPGPGAETFFYTNQQSARLMFYHDHAWGITRLNVYAGEVAPYLVTDAMEKSLIGAGGALEGLGTGIPLVIQDKTFVPSPAVIGVVDPTWNYTRWGGEGNLWTPHVYMPAQNPGDPSGMSEFGRWMYGPWFWPPANDAKYPPIANPYYDPTCDPNVVLPDGSTQFCEPALIPSTPNVSVGMEAFNDTPVVNGTAYPTTTLQPQTYRFRILNGSNDRFWNLSWYVADPRTGTLSEVALKPTELAAAQTDPVTFPTPDTQWSPKGPDWIQIGTEGGFLPAPVVVPAHEMTWVMDPTRFDVGNGDQHSLLLAPAERADVIVDFSQFRGRTLILYNDAPAAFPAHVPGYDYYTGGPDMTPAGAPTTLPGYGPNTRTVMQVKVAVGTGTPVAFDKPNTSNDRLGALQTAFAHHTDGSGVFESSMDPIIVGQAAYNSAYGTNFVANGWCNSPKTPSTKCDGYARISEGSRPTDTMKFDTLNGAQLSMNLQPKGMHDEMNSADFDEWGRMTANLGLEAPGATPLLQNIILYPYVNPATEVLDSTGMPSSLHVTPISSAADGTQIWKITHNGVDTHPIHWHLYDVQVLNRVTWDGIIIPPEPTELGWKETVRVSPLEDTIVALRPIVPTLPFALPDSIRPLNPAMPLGAKGDITTATMGHQAGFNNVATDGNPMTVAVSNDMTNFLWEYVFHCHILSHEEMDMMRPVTVKVDSVTPDAPVLSFQRGSIILNWTDGTPVDYANPFTWGSPKSEIGYRVERSVDGAAFAKIADIPANVVTYTDPTADQTLTNVYRVTAWNKQGTAVSNDLTVPGLPKAPTALTATAQPNAALAAGYEVALGWTNNAPSATSVEVERAAGGTTAFSNIATLTAPASSYIDQTVSPGNYSYRVRVIDAIGPSAYSNVADVTVPQPASTTLLLDNPSPSFVGQSVTFTATVSPTLAAGTPTGTVTFTGAGAPVALDAAGQATFTTSTLPLGTTRITATYSGDSVFSPSSDFVDHVVSMGTTSTALTSSGSPSVNGDPVTFTATVTVVTGVGTPTGTVEFFDGATSLGVQSFNGVTAAVTTSTLAIGSHTIKAVYSGDASFTGSTATGSHTVNPGSTSTSVVGAPNASVFGNSVTFTATVSTTNVGSPTGTVDFMEGATLLGTGTLSTGGLATFSTAGLSVGSHPITAVYSGDTAFTGSTGALTQVVGQGTTATIVATSLTPSVYGVQVTFTATVAVQTGSGAPSGTVNFLDNGVSFGSSPISGTQASFTTASLAVGSHTISAVYSGDVQFVGSTGTVTQMIIQGTTATALSSSINPSVEGGSVTFTANVSTVTGVGFVSGSVLFLDGATSLGLQLLSGGSASITLSTLVAGNHAITAVYSGDTNFTGSTSSVLNQYVKRATATVVTSNRTPAANLGQTITFTATVRPVTGTGIPTGTVQFNIDGGAIVTALLPLNAQGRATYSTNVLNAGTHSVVANYSGTAVFAAGASPTFSQVVNLSTTTTVVTSSRNPSVFGQTVTLTARVQPNPVAVGVLVEFFDGSTSLGSYPLDSTGRARLPISTLAVGTHGITSVFPGTVNYTPSTSAAFNQTVNKANTRTVVTTSGTPALRNTQVTFVATVSAINGGVGVPGSTVQFRIDGANLGSPVSLSGGQATYVVPPNTLSIGTHTVAAVYAGDANFNGSTSNNINQRIR